jgi:hypothetical protein
VTRHLLVRATLVVALGGCRLVTPPKSDEEHWIGDVPAKGLAVALKLDGPGSSVSGTGEFQHLTNLSAESLQFTGTRRADSLFLTFTRNSGFGFSMRGRFLTPAKVLGEFDGSEFTKTAVSIEKK